MRTPRLRYLLASVAIMTMLGLTLIPAVPYRLSIADPFFPYRLQGYQACENEYAVNNILNADLPAFLSCIAQYRIPPINVTGYGSVTSLLGFGLQPFPRVLTVGEPDFYAALYTDGIKVIAAEEVPQMDVVFNPPGILITNTSVSQGLFANSTVTVTVTNRSGHSLVDPMVLISVPGTGGNFTDDNGMTWIFFGGAYQNCLTDGLAQNVTTGASCTATFHPLIAAPLGGPFRYSVEVRGSLGSEFSITRVTLFYSLSAQSVSRLWVNQFIKLVNHERNGSGLVESSRLDGFASMRFGTAVSQPDISDYGFSADEQAFFGTNTSSIKLAEVLLYPDMATGNPYSYANFVQGYAPGHWSALMDPDYTRFGYYVGTGPYEVVHLPCPVVETPGAGINITQYFENAGCTVTVEPSTWLVLILSN